MNFNATFLVSLISFVVFTLIMNELLYKPICAILQKRQQYFEENKNVIEQNSNKTLELNQKHAQEIEKAKEKSKEITSNAFEEAKNKKQNALNTAKNEAITENALKLQEVKNEKETMREEFEGIAKNLSDNIVQKILKGEENA